MSQIRHLRSHVFLALISAILLPGTLCGAIRPSFTLEGNTWYATDIIIASEGETIDGKLEVLEVLAGALKKGDSLTVPELDQFQTEKSRTVSRFWGSLTDKSAPQIIPADQLILFLQRDLKNENPDSNWKSASKFGGLKVSLAWIHNERVFGFTQIINPGPAVLVDLGFSKEQFIKKISDITVERQSLNDARALPDTKLRAKAAAALFSSPSYRASQGAFTLISECGADAFPHLREILNDPNKLQMHREAVKALGIAGGLASVPELIKMVQNELSFWKKTAPGLKQGWWNNMKDERVGNLRSRYGVVLEVFYTLRKLKSPTCQTAVTEFRDYWRSLPQLEDKKGLTQMSNACDAVLEAIAD